MTVEQKDSAPLFSFALAQFVLSSGGGKVPCSAFSFFSRLFLRNDNFYFARQSVLAKGRKHMCYVQENSIGEIRIVTVCIHPLTRLGDSCTLK